MAIFPVHLSATNTITTILPWGLLGSTLWWWAELIAAAQMCQWCCSDSNHCQAPPSWGPQSTQQLEGSTHPSSWRPTVYSGPLELIVHSASWGPKVHPASWCSIYYPALWEPIVNPAPYGSIVHPAPSALGGSQSTQHHGAHSHLAPWQSIVHPTHCRSIVHLVPLAYWESILNSAPWGLIVYTVPW